MPTNNNQRPTTYEVERVAEYIELYRQNEPNCWQARIRPEPMSQHLRMSPSKIWACIEALEQQGRIDITRDLHGL